MGRRSLIVVMFVLSAACGHACVDKSICDNVTDTGTQPVWKECELCPKSCCFASSVRDVTPPLRVSPGDYFCADPILCVNGARSQWIRTPMSCDPTMINGNPTLWPRMQCVVRDNSASDSYDDVATCFDTTSRCVPFQSDAGIIGYALADVPGNIQYP